MQGIQSSIVPEKTEKRGLMSAPNGPLEAAKRYLERQRESEAALTAVDAEGADAHLDDGRPAWLRRWQGEAPHPAPGMSPEMTSGTTAAMNAASGSVEEAVQSLADGTGHGDQAPAVNGYTGQSIEASFDFETVFHFETELEAEGTEDWLDLLGERSQPEASGHTPDLLHPERDLERSELKAWEIPFETTHREEPRRSTEAFAAVEPLPDPQAVRAAIFRLAHEASNRWRTPQDLPETPGTSGKLGIDGARNGLPLDLSRDADTDVAPAAESGTGNPDIGFAAVARQVWCRPEGINPADRILISRANPEGTFSSTEDSHPVHESAELRDTEHSNGHSSIQAVCESVAGVVKVDLTGSVSGIWGGANGLAAPETARETSVAAAQNASPTEYTRQEQPGGNGLPRSCATPSTPPRMEHPEGKLEQEGTLNRALGGIRSEVQDEIRDEMRRGTRSQSTEVDDARVASLPESLPDTSTPNLRGMQDTASDAPALAHDASNLLSALKLYSELLALSGVLQARHSHYAQDLKLLAARSEVLIDRLLASCSLAERDARQLIQDHVLDGAGPASLDSANAPALERGAGETAGAMPNGSSLPSRAAEWDSSQCHSVAPEEDLLTEDVGVVAAPSLVSSFSRKLEEPSSGRVEALQESAIKSGVARIESPIENSIENPIDIPEKERFVAEVTQFPGKDSAARLAEAELSPTGARDVGANSGPGVDPINLVDLLTRWGSLLSMIARGPVEVKFGPQAALPIQVGEEAMERILVNLVHNAMTATRNGGAIRIGVGRAETRRPALSPPSSEERVRPASKMVLTVDDSGCGMSEQQIAKALGMGHAKIGSVGLDSGLDPGLDTGSDRDRAIEAGLHLGGSHRRHGMGLKIVRELVAASGGELAIYSRCGVGTRIEIRWPILQETVEQGDRRQVQSAKVSGEASGGFTHNRLRQGLEGAIAC